MTDSRRKSRVEDPFPDSNSDFQRDDFENVNKFRENVGENEEYNEENREKSVELELEWGGKSELQGEKDGFQPLERPQETRGKEMTDSRRKSRVEDPFPDSNSDFQRDDFENVNKFRENVGENEEYNEENREKSVELELEWGGKSELQGEKDGFQPLERLKAPLSAWILLGMATLAVSSAAGVLMMLETKGIPPLLRASWRLQILTGNDQSIL
eukprot:TRINITY_DN5840_c0_g1_i1.p1 TRINITY_DN5840_c0_g1~~TRINITY_DN5840_c0_g1_i1.p1  ORF type:complete len:228 (+),score=82.24 TRINITY_DN5840_c0_g1_i1:47-685(+)